MRSVEDVLSGRLHVVAVGFGAVVLLAVLITVAVSLLGRSSRGVAEEPFEFRHRFQRRPLSIEHFVLPTALSQEPVVPIRFREPQEAWSRDEIERFLLDSRLLGLEYLRGENAAQLRRMLDAIP